jgi:hypothetical protein
VSSVRKQSAAAHGARERGGRRPFY